MDQRDRDTMLAILDELSRIRWLLDTYGCGTKTGASENRSFKGEKPG